MENFSIIQFLLNNIDITITTVLSLAFLIVNIILAIKNKDKSMLKDALLKLPEVILEIEEVSKGQSFSSLQKKSMAEALLNVRYGKIYQKNYQLFDDAIEDILKTPQKKGGSSDVSKESQSQER